MRILNHDQYGLALHTSSPQLGLSLSNFFDHSRHQTWNLDRELSNYLHQYLADFLVPLTWQNLAFIAVAKGPGSFTSTRIGVVTARTLAQQLKLPLFGISTLAALAFSKREQYNTDVMIPVQMKATQEQLYAAIYQKASEQALKIHLADRLINPQEWQDILKKFELTTSLLEVPTHLGITATSILELAYQDWQAGKQPHWSEVLPFYGGE
ncbi:tRNA (adenosine(37)-N6)-threonylcarbamoyltransferase complex dimerization subunit type 1 TsaB [Gloeothece verrucosa]|uniref:Peptidase M22 glycoprotease n=1 Tax=Gloeothece verrucosa (strain PCC 7822) TaxID=497965 RepID=E0U987_GLOV7|nr:tRNA (adenosine(37)-N6)-threonylcarbamoyltransferase complex dimerization subunit type 1 TsaB [Gloeothece verrucosa]ADN17345.1 peptidase M22 glycoprotease [Gloeothece verrucosa PCC 7822]